MIRPRLVARGVDALLAELTVLVLHVAMETWLEQPTERSLSEVVATCFDRLRGVLNPRPAPVV